MLRMVWGIFFLGSSIFNLTYTRVHPEFYQQFADMALLSVYTDFIEKIVVPNAEIFTYLLVVFELAVGLLTLSKNIFVKVGLIASIIFILLLIPVIPPYTFVNLLVVIIPGFLIRKQYKYNVFREIITRKH
jgi:hypothetical protein